MGEASRPPGTPSIETTWSTDKQLRKRCLLQLAAALEGSASCCGPNGREVGLAPVTSTYGPTNADGLIWPAKFIDEFAWERDLPEGNTFGVRSLAQGGQGAVGVGRGDRSVEAFSLRVTDQQAGPGPRTGNTVNLEGGPQYAMECHAHRSPGAEQTNFSLLACFQVITTSDNAWPEDL